MAISPFFGWKTTENAPLLVVRTPGCHGNPMVMPCHAMRVSGLVPCGGLVGDHSAAAKDALPGAEAVGHGRGGDPRDMAWRGWGVKW